MQHPSLHIKLFGHNIHSFHFFGVTGYITGLMLGLILSKVLSLLPLTVLLLAAVGAATFFLLAFIAKWITKEETIVYYHHEIAILVFCSLTLYFLHKPILQYLDISLLGIGVFLGFGRIGCYSVGCCHGIQHKHGVKYGQAHVNAGFTWFYKDTALLPVQLIESAYVFLIVVASIVLLFHRTPPGTVLIVYTVVYGMMRFVLEYFRGDPERPLWQGLSEAQWTTLTLTFVTFLMSRFNWLPVYHWHGIILGLMGAASMYTIYYYKKHASQKLFSPPHIRQLAEGLHLLEEKNALLVKDGNPKVNIYTTNAGLSVSCNSMATGPVNVKHYTVSFKNKTMANPQLMHRVARIIGEIKKSGPDYELMEPKKGIYHIVFGNKFSIDQHFTGIQPYSGKS